MLVLIAATLSRLVPHALRLISRNFTALRGGLLLFRSRLRGSNQDPPLMPTPRALCLLMRMVLSSRCQTGRAVHRRLRSTVPSGIFADYPLKAFSAGRMPNYVVCLIGLTVLCDGWN